MPLLVMKFVGAKYGNKNVKIILVEKMMLCNDEIFGGKSWQATYPQSPSLLYVWWQLIIENIPPTQDATEHIQLGIPFIRI